MAMQAHGCWTEPCIHIYIYIYIYILYIDTMTHIVQGTFGGLIVINDNENKVLGTW